MVDDGSNILQWVLGQVGLGGIAAMALWMLRETYRMMVLREQEITAQSKEDKSAVLLALTENSRILSRLTTLLEAVLYERIKPTHPPDR